MTTIKATCPTCGEVGLTPDEIELRVDSLDAAASFYAFACPTCRDTVRKPADARIVRLLMSGGVAVRPADPAAPRRRRLAERFDGPPFTHDDLLDFHTLLARDDWFDALVQRDPAAAPPDQPLMTSFRLRRRKPDTKPGRPPATLV